MVNEAVKSSDIIDSRLVRLFPESIPNQRRLSPDAVIQRCRLLGVKMTRKTLQFYAAERLIPKPIVEYEQGKPGKRSYYDVSVVERLACIHLAKTRYDWPLNLIQQIVQHKRDFKTLLIRLDNLKKECGPGSSFGENLHMGLADNPEYIWDHFVVPMYGIVLARGWDYSLGKFQRALLHVLKTVHGEKSDFRSDKQRYRAIAIALLAKEAADESKQ